jgi:glutamyl-tRNA synthetase
VIRVRFAPSPTGYLHVGGARTALFNWLFARRHGGSFVLRIEDTDAERSSSEMVDGILEGLRWLGLDWDEGPVVGGPYGPYFQSRRFNLHRAMAEQLLARGAAYHCFCTHEELKTKREAAERAGGGWIYDRTCAALTPDEIAARERAGLPRAVRFRMPAAALNFDDIVHGPIAFDGAGIEDFIIVRSDGHPTYQLSVVSDDVEMKITHVIRGDDHISNTPKQIALYRALGAPMPSFAHVPLILGADKKRLSKRHGATSVTEYANRGYLPEAMVNFLSLLGWSPGKGDRELFSRSELAAVFDLEGISGGNAVFSVEKLDWFNQQHLALLPPRELVSRVQPFLEAEGLWEPEYLSSKREWVVQVLRLLTPRVKKVDEFPAVGRFFFTDALDYDRTAVEKHLLVAGMPGHLAAVDAAFAAIAAFDAAATEAALRDVAAVRQLKAATLIHAVRVALTGRTVSPGLFEVCELLGRERTKERLAAAVRLASAPHS